MQHGLPPFPDVVQALNEGEVTRQFFLSGLSLSSVPHPGAPSAHGIAPCGLPG
ncbi:MAG: hypothetical protein R3E93_09985 [Thiothrix sp.]